MQQRIKKRIVRGLGITLALYLAGGVLLYFGQEYLLFHPVSLHQNHQFAFPIPFTEENLKMNGHNLNFVKFRPAGTSKGIVLFYHGNMRNVEHYNSYPPFFTRNGYEVWMIDYPGYGKTTGERTEERLYADALAFYEKAKALYPPGKIVVYGKSLGTGIASYVASRRSCRQVVLETPYYSIPELAGHYAPIYPVSILSRYQLPVYAHLARVKTPVTLFHGTRDEVTPYGQAQQLARENPDANLVTFPGGRHNNLNSYTLFQQKLDSLLLH